MDDEKIREAVMINSASPAPAEKIQGMEELTIQVIR